MFTNGALQAYLAQILSALNAVHAGDLVHRGVCLIPCTSECPQLIPSVNRYIHTMYRNRFPRGAQPTKARKAGQRSLPYSPPRSPPVKSLRIERLPLVRRTTNSRRMVRPFSIFSSPCRCSTLLVSYPHNKQMADLCVVCRECKDVKNDSALSYTRHRDIHAVGIVLLQMLIGHDVMERFEDPQAALQYGKSGPRCFLRSSLFGSRPVDS